MRPLVRSSLRVLTWNVGLTYFPVGYNALPDFNVDRVAHALDELRADVVLLQELARPAQLTRLLRRLPQYRGAMAENCGYDRKVAVLVRADLSPSFEQHRLEPTGRGLVGATFSFGARRVLAMSLHMDAFFNTASRHSQANALAALSASRDECAIVVGGDLNLDPEFAARFDVAQDVATFRLLSEQFLYTGRSGPTLLGGWQVDHLFVGGAHARPLWTRTLQRRLPLGDHRPVLLELEVAQPIDGDDASL